MVITILGIQKLKVNLFFIISYLLYSEYSKLNYTKIPGSLKNYQRVLKTSQDVLEKLNLKLTPSWEIK